MGLVRVAGGKRDEELDNLAGLRTAVAVVAEEDDGGGGELGGADCGLEVGPEGLELGEVAMDVAYADDRSFRRYIAGVDGECSDHRR